MNHTKVYGLVLGGEGDQDPGDPGVGKVRGGGDNFFSFKQGGELTLDHTMFSFSCFLKFMYQKTKQFYNVAIIYFALITRSTTISHCHVKSMI